MVTYPKPKEIAEQLETMVDGFGLADILGTLSEICAGKAEHLASNWQDHKAAKAWERRAAVLDKTSARILQSFSKR